MGVQIAMLAWLGRQSLLFEAINPPDTTWLKRLARYRKPDRLRSLFELGVTFVPIVLLWALGPIWLFIIHQRLPIGMMRDGFAPWLPLAEERAAVRMFSRSRAC